MKQSILKLNLSQIFFWMFLIVLPFNKRIIYNPEQAYIQGYFSYYLAYFVYLSDILLFLCLVSYFFENRDKLHTLPQKSWLKSPIFWLILAIILPMFHMKQNFWGLYSVLKILEFLALGLFVTQNIQILKLRVIAWIVGISGIFQAILGIWQFHVQHSLGLSIIGEYIADLGTGGLATLDTASGKVIRAYGTFPHPNILGLYLVFALILCYFLKVSRETSKKAQIFHGFGEFLLILGIFLTFSRIAWVSAIFAFLAYLWHNNKHLKLNLILPGLLSLIAIVSFWHNLILSRVDAVSGSNSYIQRVTLNNAGFRVWETSPWFGVRAGNYIYSMQNLFHVQPWEYQPPHNIFIYIGASFGIFGLIIFLWLLYKIFQLMWNSEKTEFRFALIVLAAIFVFASNFDHFLVTIQQGQLMFALSLGLMAGLPKLKNHT